MSIENDQLDDIEDIVGERDLVGLERSIARSNAVGKRVKKIRNSKKVPAPSANINPVSKHNGSNIPGIQKIWVKTWGMCLIQ